MRGGRNFSWKRKPELNSSAGLDPQEILIHYMLKIIETLDTGSQVSAEMSDHALICCAVRTRTGEPRDQRTDLGLVNMRKCKCLTEELVSQIKNHAYGVTGVRKVAIGSGINAVLRREKLSLVRNMMTIKENQFQI